jgi:hypothetical protein
MKTRTQYFVVVTILAIISFSTSVMAQPSPDDTGGSGIPGGGDPGGSSIGSGSGAPTGEGVYFLIALVAVYGISRWYAINKQNSQLA